MIHRHFGKVPSEEEITKMRKKDEPIEDAIIAYQKFKQKSKEIEQGLEESQ